MKRWLIVLVALLVAPVFADTVNERMTSLRNATGVLAAEHNDDARHLPYTNVHVFVVTYLESVTADTVKENSVRLVVLNYVNDDDGTAYWYGQLPEPLRPAPAETKFITDRTGGGFTEAQIKSQVQAMWTNAGGTEAIIGLTVAAVDGKTIRITGSFPDGAGGRETRTYLLWLVDANGSVTPGNANIKWQREVEGAP